ncbi:hypothetical protein RB597_003439 [Gaeumannomyces tritici]
MPPQTPTSASAGLPTAEDSTRNTEGHSGAAGLGTGSNSSRSKEQSVEERAQAPTATTDEKNKDHNRQPRQQASPAAGAWTLPKPPIKQKMASGIRSLLSSAKKLALGDSSGNGSGSGPAATADRLFAKTEPGVDGEACSHDCDSCTVKFPRGFKIDESDVLYGQVKGWATHVLVATGKSDWVRDVADEKGSVMEAVDAAADRPANGRLMLSACDMPVSGSGHGGADYSVPTTALVLPAFRLVDGVTPATAQSLLSDFVAVGPTNDSPMAVPPPPPPPPLPATNGEERKDGAAAAQKDQQQQPQQQQQQAALLPRSVPSGLTSRPCPHSVLVLLCSQRTRDARCGQSAPLLRRELERHLRPLGLHRDPDDERPGGVGVCFVSHVGGHKYSANVLVYRRPDPFGLDSVSRAEVSDDEVRDGLLARSSSSAAAAGKKEAEDVGAAQCIWLARIAPPDVENLVRYTILQGKVVKPETQLRGGFDRQKGLLSW